MADFQPKRILIIGRYLGHFGGAHKYLLRLVTRLTGHKSYVSVAMNYEPDNRLFREQLVDAGATVFELPFENVPNGKAAAILDGILNQLQPDVLDCESAAKSVREVLLSSEQMRICKAKKLFTMHLAIKSEKGPSSYRDLINPLSDWQRTKRSMRRFIRLFGSGISVSQHHLERINRFLGIKNEFFEYIPNGVDPDQYIAKGNYSTPGPLTIGGCGGLMHQKRFDLLISVVRNLLDRGLAVRGRIAGEGEERFELEKQVRGLGLQEHVELVGYCDDIPKFLSELDIFMMPSDHEGFPYAQLEAMVTGIPSVVTDTGDQRILVEDSVDGYVVPIGDVEALTVATERLCNDAKKREDFGNAARQKVLSRYNALELERITISKFMIDT